MRIRILRERGHWYGGIINPDAPLLPYILGTKHQTRWCMQNDTSHHTIMYRLRQELEKSNGN